MTADVYFRSRRGGRRCLPGARPWIMGVVNVTPDSFSDGGQFVDVDAAVAHGVALWRAGADVLDVGGEATNPRATPIEAETEYARVSPVLRRLAVETDAALSIDTTKGLVAAWATLDGAEIINDVSGGNFERGAIWHAAADAGAAYICGHLRVASLVEVFAAETAPTPAEVEAELAERLAAMPAALRDRSIVDPGLGFGKGAGAGNWALLDGAGALAARLGRQVLIGASRKRFVRADLPADATPVALDDASAAAAARAIAAGAHGVRVHDVARTVAALRSGAPAPWP